MTAPKTAMVLAAGLGTRMRPLTDDRPKALVEVGGRALVDHVLDRLAEAGVETAVVNVHWFADRLVNHLLERARPRILISDEREALLETGGGLRKARPLLGDDPVFVANIDSVWTDGSGRSGGWVEDLVRLWDPARMDVCLLLARREGSIGFEGDGDFFLGEDGRLVAKDIEAQCRSCFDNVKAVLEDAGVPWANLVDVTVFLTDMKNDFPTYNKVYAEYFAGPGNPNPTRTTLGITSLPTPIAVEVKAIAVVG
jgi:MurNAc alpha-1-phosphate uridylyltransferase